MFDHAMWIEYLSIGIACGFLGVAFWQLATRDRGDQEALYAAGTALLVIGAVCAWLAPVVRLPEHTAVIIVVTGLIAAIVAVSVAVGTRRAYKKLLRSRPQQSR